ncbi:GHKL domain-containing protein [Clostridium sp. P21]|uniref:histidine kinase n=1 Tax=Clostridium muellerianum TaxID=2716538 RepID=A0A7Y0EE11_9CLOT|nr:HAMP domain-containing sensor histidine kinase [Clostridium muellerianum]NMM61687.1 GHKL domain-containing protein [Clostridium muellerianum]
MKKLFSKGRTVFIAIAFLFIIGQILGFYAIRYLFFQYKTSELEPLAKQLSSQYANNSTLNQMPSNVIIKIFDVYGNDKEKQSSINMKDVAKKFIPQIIEGKTISSMENISSLPHTSVVIGVPIEKDNLVIGALFVLVPADDINAALKGFMLVFTVTLLIGTGIIGVLLKFYIRESRELDYIQKEYVANVSHELKSPVSSIKALTETLADNVITDEDTRQKYYGIILKESARLQSLISDILELSRLQSGKIVIEKQTINTKELLEEVFDKYSIIMNDLGIAFEVTNAAWSTPDVLSSKDRVLQIFCILIDNAIKFVDENGKIIINARTNHSDVIFEIVDNGIGIKPEILPHIFDRFYKEDTSHNTKGSGLGLSIAKEIVSVLHEDISVKSEYEKGTTFFFTIKRA